MNRMNLVRTGGLALMLCGMSVFAFAPKGGHVTTVIGSAKILRDSAVIRAEKGTVVQAGDVLKTPIDGRLQWWMEDDSMVAMATSSRVHIRNFDVASGDVLYSLQRGAMRVISGTVHPTVLTPVAKISAMGTDFSSFLCANASCSNSDAPSSGKDSLYVSVAQGRIIVQNPAGSVEAGAGQVVFVASANEAPRIIDEAKHVQLDTSVELEFELGAGDFIPDVPVQPLPPVELPGSPS